MTSKQAAKKPVKKVAKKAKKRTKKEVVLAKIFDDAIVSEKFEAHGLTMGSTFSRALNLFINYHLHHAASRAKANGRTVVESHDIHVC